MSLRSRSVHTAALHGAIRAALVTCALAGSPAPALAQGGAIRGSVEDAEGRAIKGAVIKATNPAGRPDTLTATSDAKGRFAIIGLIGGLWSFSAEAPGYVSAQSASRVRSVVTGNTPVEFVLARAEAVLPGALTKQIHEDLAEAERLRAGGRLDQAITAYQDIAEKNPALTSVQLVLGDAYRQKAAREAVGPARTLLLDRAVAAYQQVLKADAGHQRARIELAVTQVERGAFAEAEQALGVLASQPKPGRDVLFAVGEIRLGRGELDAARQAFEQVNRLDSAWARPMLRLGVIAVRQGHPEAATALFQRVVAADPGGTDAGEAAEHLKRLGR